MEMYDENRFTFYIQKFNVIFNIKYLLLRKILFMFNRALNYSYVTVFP